MKKPSKEKTTNTARVVAYTISDDVEIQIRHIIQEILKSYNRTELMAPIFTSVKELIINAIKANYKNIYFGDNAFNNNQHGFFDYEKALEQFKLEMSRENSTRFEEFARRDDIKAVIDLWTEDTTLHVQVANPARMSETEIKNINKKLADAENCRDLADYCINNLDDPHREGAGLGLILIMMMLKSLKAPKDSLVITSEQDKTMAYLRIPLVHEKQ